MTQSPKRIVQYMLTAFGVLLLLLVLFVNGSLADLAELVYPGSALWTHGVLLGLELLGLVWLWKGLFGGRRHLLLTDADSPEAEQAFAQELTRRMKDNIHIRKAQITPQGPDASAYLERCLALLNAKADEEIRNNAKRIFLATALSQNGRIDALIMFLSLCRLVWRVSGVYNQQPHPKEVAALYWTVISSAFLSLSIEELDIPTEISVGFGEAFHAMAPAGMTASIPFAGKALQTFTASTIDGAANCYLALRAGIITRNAYAYAAKAQERPGRAAVFKEAGVLLLAMSHELVEKLASALADNLADAARSAGCKTVQAGKDVAGAVGSGAGKIAQGAAGVGKGFADGVGKVGKDVAGAVGSGAGKIAQGAAGVGKGFADGVGKVGKGAGRAGKSLGQAVSSAAASSWKVVKKPFKRARKT